MKKFCCISDTHAAHRDVMILPCDFLIHSGDMFFKSEIDGIIEFIDWLSNLPARYKILVAGNHDRFINRNKETFLKLIEGKIIYLENSGIEIEGIKFWGSPSVKWIGPYKHFAYQNEQEAEKIFNQIPDDTDILITHGPPYQILDSEAGMEGVNHYGSPTLLEHVLRVKPQYHLFGHVHKSYGIYKNCNTTFINSCIVNNNEDAVNQPIAFEYQKVHEFSS